MKQKPNSKMKSRGRVVFQRGVSLRPETPLQEVERMKMIMRHYRKLTLPSRDFVVWLQEKYKTDALPEVAG